MLHYYKGETNALEEYRKRKAEKNKKEEEEERKKKEEERKKREEENKKEEELRKKAQDRKKKRQGNNTFVPYRLSSGDDPLQALLPNETIRESRNERNARIKELQEKEEKKTRDELYSYWRNVDNQQRKKKINNNTHKKQEEEKSNWEKRMQTLNEKEMLRKLIQHKSQELAKQGITPNHKWYNNLLKNKIAAAIKQQEIFQSRVTAQEKERFKKKMLHNLTQRKSRNLAKQGITSNHKFYEKLLKNKIDAAINQSKVFQPIPPSPTPNEILKKFAHSIKKISRNQHNSTSGSSENENENENKNENEKNEQKSEQNNYSNSNSNKNLGPSPQLSMNFNGMPKNTRNKLQELLLKSQFNTINNIHNIENK